MILRNHSNKAGTLMNQTIRVTGMIGSLALLAVAAGCASPSDTTKGVTMAEVDAQEIICHERAPTGSRLIKKTCKTRAEWDADAEQSKEIKRSLQRDTAPLSDAPTIGN